MLRCAHQVPIVDPARIIIPDAAIGAFASKLQLEVDSTEKKSLAVHQCELAGFLSESAAPFFELGTVGPVTAPAAAGSATVAGVPPGALGRDHHAPGPHNPTGPPVGLANDIGLPRRPSGCRVARNEGP